MKGSLVLCLVFAVVGLEANTVHLEGAQKEKAAQLAGECIKNTGVKPESVIEASIGHVNDDDAKLEKFFICFFQKAGIVGDDGKVNVDVALSKLPSGVDKADVAKVLEGCMNNEGKDTPDTSFEIFKCYNANTKTYIVL